MCIILTCIDVCLYINTIEYVATLGAHPRRAHPASTHLCTLLLLRLYAHSYADREQSSVRERERGIDTRRCTSECVYFPICVYRLCAQAIIVPRKTESQTKMLQSNNKRRELGFGNLSQRLVLIWTAKREQAQDLFCFCFPSIHGYFHRKVLVFRYFALSPSFSALSLSLCSAFSQLYLWLSILDVNNDDCGIARVSLDFILNCDLREYFVPDNGYHHSSSPSTIIIIHSLKCAMDWGRRGSRFIFLIQFELREQRKWK